jgi:hypothetical protein
VRPGLRKFVDRITGRSSKPAPRPAAPGGPVATVIEYSPCLDGDPDPGEVVWTWVPYEDDPNQGKDRPVVVFGRRGNKLVAVPLTSKQHDNEPQFAMGAGSWDRDGRPSYAKLERILEIEPSKMRREGAVLDRRRFDELVAAIQRVHQHQRRKT